MGVCHMSLWCVFCVCVCVCACMCEKTYMCKQTRSCARKRVRMCMDTSFHQLYCLIFTFRLHAQPAVARTNIYMRRNWRAAPAGVLRVLVAHEREG